MVEVLFGESEAGAMKAAKTDVFSKIVCLAFMLDIGNIKEPVDSEYRKDLIFSMLNRHPWGSDPDIDAELKEAGRFYVNELERLKKFWDEGESVRIWYSDSPYSLCGLYFVCGLLKDRDNPVSAVKLPEYEINSSGVTVLYQNWGEVCPEEFIEFLKYERLLTREDINIYGCFWNKLAEENAPLRTVINGRMISVNEDFYDFLIWKHLTCEPIKQARLIGDLLGSYQIGIFDWWYAGRIEKFIEQGKINIIKDSENKYARAIKKLI